MITNYFEICGPDQGKVETWAQDYIHYPYPRRPACQKALATEIKTRCAKLRPADGQVLNATFFGDKRDGADVENLVLYNIDSFGKSSDNGVRFEPGAAAPAAPSGSPYPFSYHYELVADDAGFHYWQPVETLASFDWVDLGELKGEKLAPPVWLAVVRAYERGQTQVFFSDFRPDSAFAVKVQIRPPGGHTRVLGNMVKGIVDGLVCAFQAHTDMTVLRHVVPHLALNIQAASPALKASPAEIAHYLRERGRGVLGEVPLLIGPHGDNGNGNGIAFAPDVHVCVAGELLRVDPAGDPHWAITADVVTLAPRND